MEAALLATASSWRGARPGARPSEGRRRPEAEQRQEENPAGGEVVKYLFDFKI